jgi:hypothetical protein
MTPADARLVELERAVRSNARWTTGLTVLFIALVAAAVIYVYTQAQKILNPTRLVDEGEDFIASHYPEWREEVKKELVQAAPALGHEMMKHSEESMPQTRARIERYLDREAKAGVDRAQVLADEEFRQFVRDSHAEIQRGFDEMRKAPDETSKFVEDLEARLDKRFGVNLRREAGVVLETLDQFNAKLDRLARGEKLTKSEEVERRIAQTLRALQQEEKAAR